MLNVEGLVKKFGNFRALDGADISVKEGKILGLAGPNGSGKTTFINVVSGVYKPNGGKIFFNGKSIYKLEPHTIVHLGLNRTFQVPKPLSGLTVEQNVKVAAVYGSKEGNVKDKINSALNSVELDNVKHKEASSLTSAQQKLLGLARALATNPKMLLIDEIAAGLNQHELKRIADMLIKLNKFGITMIVVEHLMSFLDILTDDVVVMNAGVNLFRGSIKEASMNEEVVEVFLGR